MPSGLWSSPLSTWTHYYRLYPEALAKKNAALHDAETHLLQISSAVQARTPPSLTAADYRAIVDWKLIRGKFRPTLKALSMQLSDEDVSKASSAALAALSGADHQPHLALERLLILKGCGPATASAVLSVVSPHFPFMSDELLLTVMGERKYSKNVSFFFPLGPVPKLPFYLTFCANHHSPVGV